MQVKDSDDVRYLVSHGYHNKRQTESLVIFVCIVCLFSYLFICFKMLFTNNCSYNLSGTSQRLNGRVSGVLNGIPFDNLDMHSFVVTKDGRAYTAISRVPVEIGPHMMTLNTIGGVIGWLFALPISAGALNGYSFTGNTWKIFLKPQIQELLPKGSQNAR